ncbi:MAG: type I 3-dehydroquinate dehydratase [Suipraeoptans sp.]
MIRIRGVEISKENCAICAPIVSTNENDILESAKNIVDSKAEIAELRVDFYEECDSPVAVSRLLYKLRDVLGDMPLIFTFRTRTEGGNKDVTHDEYVKTVYAAVASNCIDIVDIEWELVKNNVTELLNAAHCMQVAVILSNHDFNKTPETEDIIKLLEDMHLQGADICKVAFMPQDKSDVEALRRAVLIVDAKYDNVTLVAISMGELGRLSRTNPKEFVSSITFGVVGKASAPGQIDVNELANMV